MPHTPPQSATRLSPRERRTAWIALIILLLLALAIFIIHKLALQ